MRCEGGHEQTIEIPYYGQQEVELFVALMDGSFGGGPKSKLMGVCQICGADFKPASSTTSLPCRRRSNKEKNMHGGEMLLAKMAGAKHTGMNVKMEKGKLLSILKTNRDQHEADFKKAIVTRSTRSRSP